MLSGWRKVPLYMTAYPNTHMASGHANLLDIAKLLNDIL